MRTPGKVDMGNTMRWRVIGLWRVWDELPDAPAPSERPPEALLERVAGVFDHAPSIAEAREAMAAAGTAMRDAFEARETLAYTVVEGDNRWTRAMNEGGWLPEGVRRHPPSGKHLHVLLGYGLEPSAGRRVWMHAETDRARRRTSSRGCASSATTSGCRPPASTAACRCSGGVGPSRRHADGAWTGIVGRSMIDSNKHFHPRPGSSRRRLQTKTTDVSTWTGTAGTLP